MQKLLLIGSAIAALAIAPLLTASIGNAQSRKNTGQDFGYCKSGEKVKDRSECKENGGTK
jgi:hypothetical protein